jgi:hypothetical protein
MTGVMHANKFTFLESPWSSQNHSGGANGFATFSSQVCSIGSQVYVRGKKWTHSANVPRPGQLFRLAFNLYNHAPSDCASARVLLSQSHIFHAFCSCPPAALCDSEHNSPWRCFRSSQSHLLLLFGVWAANVFTIADTKLSLYPRMRLIGVSSCTRPGSWALVQFNPACSSKFAVVRRRCSRRKSSSPPLSSSSSLMCNSFASSY